MWSHSVFRDSGLAQLIVGPAGRISVANPAANHPGGDQFARRCQPR